MIDRATSREVLLQRELQRFRDKQASKGRRLRVATDLNHQSSRVMTWPSAGALRDRKVEKAKVPVVKLVRAFGGCLGTKRR